MNNLENEVHIGYPLPDVVHTPYTDLESIIKDAFPRISSIDSRTDPKTRKTRFLIEKQNQYYELVQQGDGLKKLIILLVYLQNFGESMLIIDEPEQSLHPDLEAKIIDYFLRFEVPEYDYEATRRVDVIDIPSHLVSLPTVIVRAEVTLSDGAISESDFENSVQEAFKQMKVKLDVKKDE